MTTPLVRALQNSRVLPSDDLLVTCLATNVDRNFLVIEALAGSGKTTLLLRVISRLDWRRCIVYSFSRTAAKVIKIRQVKETGDWLNTQTFDSCWLHLVGDKAKEKEEDPTFQSYRDLVVETTYEDLEEFTCRTRDVNYSFRDIDHIFVDEAQDSPPEAFEFLNLCRKAGKSVIITGDRHQAIFQFMETTNLFDVIPACHSVHHHLTISHRCIQPVCDYVNGRFGLCMRSSRENAYPPSSDIDVSFQCRNNATMGRLYVTLLTCLLARLKVNLRTDAAEAGDSEDRFYETVYAELRNRYGLSSDERAKEVLERLLERSKRIKGPAFVLSTVHRFKGDESDLTVLAPDIDLGVVSEDTLEENVKYVACTRPRYGLLMTAMPKYIGNYAPLETLSAFLRRRRVSSWTNNVSYVVTSPLAVVHLLGDPRYRRFVEASVTAYEQRQCSWGPSPTKQHGECGSQDCCRIVGSACDVAVAWLLEQKARAHQVPAVSLHYPEYRVTIRTDRRLRTMMDRRTVDDATVARFARMIAHAKLVSLLCRYLVTRKGYRVDTPLIARGAICSALLKDTRRSVLGLLRGATECCVDDYCNILRSCVDTLPPVLRDSDRWLALELQQPIMDGPINLRGSFDVVIYDRSSRRHLIEVKCVRELSFAHFWQTAIYSTMCCVNTGATVHHPCIWSLRSNSVYSLCTNTIQAMIESVSADPEGFNTAVSAQPDPQYYSRTYEASELQCSLEQAAVAEK